MKNWSQRYALLCFVLSKNKKACFVGTFLQSLYPLVKNIFCDIIQKKRNIFLDTNFDCKLSSFFDASVWCMYLVWCRKCLRYAINIELSNLCEFIQKWSSVKTQVRVLRVATLCKVPEVRFVSCLPLVAPRNYGTNIGYWPFFLLSSSKLLINYI